MPRLQFKRNQKRNASSLLASRTASQHDAVSDGLAAIYNLGKETGLWETYIRTDTQLITKKKLEGNAKNLDYFDAVFFYTTGELSLDDSQKADLIKFVKEDGKGFI